MNLPKTWKRSPATTEMEPVYFRKWSNRKWAVYASLQKVVIIGTLSVSYQMVAQERPSAGADTSGYKMALELEEVEASGERPASMEDIGLKPVLTVSAADISEAVASSHEDLLEYLPQVDVRQRGKHGTQADLSIQAGTFDQSLVLLNGINVSDPQTGHFHLNVPLDLMATHRMELVTGSASRRYGTQAFAGAVNMVTEPGDSTYFNGVIKAGQHRYYRTGIKANMYGKLVSTLASISATGSDGYRENTDFGTVNAYMHTLAGKGSFRTHLIAGLNAREFGANAFYSPAFPRQYEETSTGLGALKLEYNRRLWQWDLQAYARVNRDMFLIDRDDPSIYRNDHRTTAAGLDTEFRLSSRLGITHTGIRFRNERIRSTSLGEPLTQKDVVIHEDSIVLGYGHIRNGLNWNLNHAWEQGPVSLSGGLLLHLNSDLGTIPGIYPGADVRIRLPHHLRAYASVNRSMRLPTFTDLYYQGPANVGNPELVPESAVTFEMGAYRKGTFLTAGIHSFYRQGRDLIDWIWMEGEQLWQPMNLTRVNALGGDVRVHYRAGQGQKRRLLLSSAFITYSHTHLAKVSGELVSRYVLDNLKHKVTLGATWVFWEHVHLSLRATAQDRNGNYQAYDPNTGTYTPEPFEPFALLDLKAGYSLGSLFFFAEASNLFDTPYRDMGNLPLPGRWIMAGMEIR